MTCGLRSSRLALPTLIVLAIGFASLTPAALPLSTALAASSGSWTTYHHDNAHTGYDSTVPAATSATTGWTSAALDGQVYAEPLVYNGLVYAATLNNTVYAINQSTGLTVWSNHLGTPQASGWICGNVAPMGILGTPVIDTAASRIYAVAEIAGTPNPTYRLFGLDLAAGTTQLNTPIAPTGFDWTIQQERGALALANGYVYIPFGGRAGDCFHNGSPYYGWVVAAQTSGIGSPLVFQTPSGAESVWSPGGVVIDDTSHNVFFPTGNAIPCAGSTLSDAIVRVSPTLTGTTFFEPNDWQANWCGPDSDLGSASPVLISPNLMFMAGKRGGGFLLDPTNLGGVNGQLFPPRSPYSQAEVCFGNHSAATYGSFAYAAPYVYLECENRGLVALNTNTSTNSFSPCGASCAGGNWTTGGTTTFGPPIVAGGVVWAASDGGGLSGFNAATGALAFQSAGFAINRFSTPAEAGGQIFVGSKLVIRSFNMVFSNTWTSLGGTLTSGPDPASWGANRLDVFLRGSDNGLWHTSWNGSAWSSQVSLGGVITSDPGAASWGTNRIDIFARGQDNGVWHMWWNGYAWSAWYPLGGVIVGGPDVSSWGANRLDVFVRGQDNGLWHQSWNGSSWSGWHSLGGVLTSDPTAVSWGLNRIDVFGRGQDNGLWHLSWNGFSWSPWQSLGGTLTSGPDASSCSNGHLDVFATGTGSALFRLGFNGFGWTAWQSLGQTWTSDPGAVCQPARSAADVFERGTDNALWNASITAS